MRPRIHPIAYVLIAACLTGCSNSDQQRAREQAAEAQSKTQEEAEKAREKARELGHDAKQEMRKLDARMNDALNRGGASTGDASQGAREKLDHAGQIAKAEGRQAARKLDNASVIARVKAKLAGDIGAATLTDVDVQAEDQVVTLNGTVPSESQKKQAERDAAQLDGVTRVVNNLTVKP